MNSALDSLIVNSPLPMAILDDSGSVVRFNRHFLELTGLKSESLKNKPFDDVIGAFDRSRPYSELGYVPHDKYPVLYRTSLHGDDTAVFAIHQIPIDDETSPKMVVVLENQTEIVSLKDENLHMSRLASAGKLVSFVVHEIGNFVSVIKGCSDLIASRGNLDESTREEIDRVRLEADRISEIIKNVLGFARKDDNCIESLSAVDLVQQAIQLKKYSLKRKRVACSLKTGSPSARFAVQGNRTLLMQVLLNLIDNAVEALGGMSQREIKFVLGKAGDKVSIEVADSGPGIPEEHRHRIFDAFYTTKKDGTGTGLGLSISRRIVQNHGGDLRLADSRPAEGSVFQILLPSFKETKRREIKRGRIDDNEQPAG